MQRPPLTPKIPRKVFVQEYYEEAVKRFKCQAIADGETLTQVVIPPSSYTSSGEARAAISLSKTRIRLQPNARDEEKDPEPPVCGSLDFVSQNGKPHSFMWHTTPEKICHALRHGLLNHEGAALTTQVISQLGQYRYKVVERMREGFRSNRHVAKDTMVDYGQDRIQMLQGIERLINTFDSAEDIATTKERIQKTLSAYQEKLVSLKTKMGNLIQQLQPFCHLEANFLEAQIQADIDEVIEFNRKIKAATSCRPYLAATGKDSLFTFMKIHMRKTIHQVRMLNQHVSYTNTAAMGRGSLHDAVVDAEYAIDRFPVDHHNPYTAESQAAYDVNFAKDDLISLDSSVHLKAQHDVRTTLVSISLIETPAKANLLPTEEVRATHWHTGGGFVTKCKKMAVWVYNFLRSFISPFKYKPHLIDEKNDKNFQDLFKHVHAEKPGIVIHVIKSIWGYAKDLVTGVIWGIKESLQSLWETAKTTYNDIDYSWHPEKKLSRYALLSAIKNEGEDLLKEKKKAFERIKGRHNRFNRRGNSAQEISVTPIAHLRHQDINEWRDALSCVSGGMQEFVDVFARHIHSKNLTCGLLFNAVYIAGLCAVLAPQASASALGTPYVNFSNDLAHALSHNPVMAANAGGFMQAKATGVGFNLLTNGPDSWLVHGLRQFENDPAKMSIAIGMSYGLGWAIANHYLYIPVLSEHLQKEMGSAPFVGQTLTGMKIMVVMYEMIHTHLAKHPELENQLKAKIREALACQNKDLQIEAMQKTLKEFSLDTHIKALFEKTFRTSANWTNIGYLDQVGQQQQRELLITLQYYKKVLPWLSFTTKDALLREINSLFPKREAEALKTMFYPDNNHSILGTTIKITFGHVGRLLRVVANMLTFSFDSLAFSDFAYAIKKDLTRVLRALKTAGKAACSWIYRCFIAPIGDILVNQIGGRMTDSTVSMRASNALDKFYENALRQRGAAGLYDAIEEGVSIPTPSTVFTTYHSSRSGLFARASVVADKNPNSPSSTVSISQLN